MNRRLAALRFVMTALSLTACTSTTPDAVASPTGETSAAPSPTSETVTEPTLPFGGDCAAALPAAEIEGYLGPGWNTAEAHFAQFGAGDVPDFAAFGTMGGLFCEWFSADGADVVPGVSALSVLVVPVDRVPAAFVDDFADAVCAPDSDAVYCRLGRVDGDLYVLARAGWAPTSPPRPRS